MGWQDRPYYRDRNSSSGNPLLWIFSGSVPLFTAFGIRVRMHATLLVLIVLLLATSGLQGGMGIANAMTFSVLLFGIILLHEFGHCFAARSVGGEANEILMWLLGGLAFADAPRRPWPQFVVAVGGPLVNVAICAITAGAIWLINLHDPRFHWNPLSLGGVGMASFYLRWTFSISMGLLIFNLLPIYPLDGGRILQAILWVKLRYYRATLVTYVVGMVGSVLLAMYGLTIFRSGYGLLIILIAASCFMLCYQSRAQLKADGPWAYEDDGIDYSAASWQPESPSRKHKKLSRRAKRRLRKQAEREESEQSRIDMILAKVSAKGMQSLTWSERRALRKATERQRRQEIEVSGDRD
jgi:Zn-dependent protease